MPSEPGFPDAAQTWNARFETPGYLFGEAPNSWLAAHRALFAAGERVLAVADGEGRNSVWLASLGLQVDAFDISTVGVAKARSLASRRGVPVDYHVAGCDDWPWEDSAYDCVVAIFVQFADPAMRARLFADMTRTLKPGGRLLLLGYTPKQLDYGTGGPGIVEHLYTQELLRNAFTGLEIIELREWDEVLDEGKAHSGPSALIGMVARKRA
jgi:SAM-dependent methyltransferase